MQEEGRRREPSPAEPLAERLKERFGEGVDPGISLEGDAALGREELSSEVLGRLGAHAPRETRYKVEDEIGRGGSARS